MSRQPGFDMRGLTMGQKAALIAGAVLFIALFFPWNSAGGGSFAGIDIPGISINGWNGMGVIAGVLALALLVWEGLNAAGALANVQAPKAQISAGLAAGAALFAIIRFFQALEGVAFGAFLGLLAALALAYAAWLRFQEGSAMTPPPPPPPPVS
ncbi:MAG TPA: hypothetical protein VE754_05835 [Actinomycetota bacterium]|jgi:hypothetical protein|nr:hypothetical protein [Actinomycetota bacterium]